VKTKCNEPVKKRNDAAFQTHVSALKGKGSRTKQKYVNTFKERVSMMGSSLLRLVMTREGGSFIDAGAQISSDTMMLALVSSTMLTTHATCYSFI
jgi:hypothetical protein